jgi:probable F420-dependent oxidoreductase
MARPFRFGISVWGATSAADWRDKARQAESAGFDVLMVPDHLVDGMLPPLIPLITAAEATDRLRVGTLVLNNDFRDPVVLAREAAAVDLFTDGRLELGLGAGHMKFEYDQAGMIFDPPAVRVARMAESAEIIRLLTAGEEVTFKGQYYQVTGHRIYPEPVQRPVPLLIGGNGRRVLATAARLADIVGFTGFSQVEGAADVNASHFTDAGLAEQVGRVRDHAGGRFDQLELSVLVQGVTITTDPRSVAAAMQGRVPQLSVEDILSSPYALTGTVNQIAEQLMERRERLGISYVTVFEKDLVAMAEVIEELQGS